MKMSHLRPAALTGLMLCLGGAGARLAAQAAAVLVRDGREGPPVVGAIVRLLRGDSTVAQGLTNEAGRITLRALATGSYFLRVSRIGFARGEKVPVELAEGQALPVTLMDTWRQILLPEISVEGRSQCGRATDDRVLAATLWEQIRQALTATSLSEESGLTLNSRVVERVLSASGAIREEHVSRAHLTGSRPFVPLAPEQLARYGYVRADADSVVYNAPDAESLLADPFVETHCFGIRAGPKGDSLSLGLTFEPVKARRLADIRGVLWVDRHSLELRALEFQYASSTQSVLESNASGRLQFSKLPSGAWYIRSWFIRMPEIERTVVRTSFRDAVTGFREHGGNAEPVDGAAPSAAPARVRGRVSDSLDGGGLAGVVVTVAGAAEFAVTDSTGAYSLAVPLAGVRQVTFAHPLLGVDSLRTRRTVELMPGGEVMASTGTPGPGFMLRALCAKDRGKSGLLGRVVTETGAPAPGIYVRAEWTPAATTGGPAHADITTANDAGLWSFCDVPALSTVVLRVGARKGAPAASSVKVEEGRFRWVTLAAAAPDIGPIAQSDSAQRLPEIKTSATVPVSRSQRFESELRDRIQRNGAPGSALITRAELERNGQFRLASLLVIHGLKERTTGRSGKPTLVCPRTTDRPAIFVDGLLVDGSDNPAAKRFRAGMTGEVFDLENLSPEDVEAVEVYRSPGQWPAEFDRTEASCVVVIWTRRGEKQP